MADPVRAASLCVKAALGTGDDWASAVKACTEALGGVPEGANLGLLYATDALADDLSSVLTFLRERTRIEHWAGNLGFGVAVSGTEVHDRPAVSILTAALPEEAFRVFEPLRGPAASSGFNDFNSAHGDWLARHQPVLGVVHGDPRNQMIETIAAEAAERCGGFLVGGLTAARGQIHQIAGQITEGGLSGVLFSADVAVAVGLSQGCSLIGTARTITQAQDGVVMTIDERPALEVFKEDIGELLAHDLRRIGGYIFAAFPIGGSDTGDYLVRNLTGIDMAKGWFSVAEEVEPGRRIQFCRRDHEAARTDLRRMVRDVKRRAGPTPRAGLYFSCIARGPHLFGPNSEELGVIQEELGEVPLSGFFGNGEIFNDRLYGYTGVLVLFK